MINVNLGFNKKKYRHDMSYTVNTTSSFGAFQPVLCQYLSRGDVAHMQSFRQLVRNAVMTSPTFGSVKCINDFRFVPVSEIYPAFEALLSGKSYSFGTKTYKPTRMPVITSRILVCFLLAPEFSTVKFFRAFSDKEHKLPYHGDVCNDQVCIGEDGTTLNVSIDSLDRSWNHHGGFDGPRGSLMESEVHFLSTSYNDGIESMRNFLDDLGLSDYRFMQFFENKSISVDWTLSPSQCDFLIFNNKDSYCYCMQLTNRGRRLYNILRGLGYSLDFNDVEEVNFLPVLAFYKAWFDSYAPSQSIEWSSTFAYKVITQILSNPSKLIYDVNYFSSFLFDLSDCYYTYSEDLVSYHRSSPSSGGDATSLDLKANDNNFSLNNDAQLSSPYLFTNKEKSVVGIKPASGSAITDVAMRTVSRLARFLNKNGVIGNRVRDYIVTHYGGSDVSSFFGVSNSVARLVTDIDFSELYSTSDTAASGGSPLGTRSGYGQGYNNSSFRYEARDFGFLIGMMAIYPVVDYTQGSDPWLSCLDRFSLPNEVYDSLGYELTPVSHIFDGLGISLSSDSDNFNKGFGFVPRLSMLKQKKSILNGEMALNSTKDSFLGFHLDRLIVPYYLERVEPEGENSNDFKAILTRNSIPYDSVGWQYCGKYPQLGWYDRIFYNAGTPYDFKNRSVVFNDNFVIQCGCSFYVSNCLKPLSESFDTFDEETDNTSRSVTLR